MALRLSLFSLLVALSSFAVFALTAQAALHPATETECKALRAAAPGFVCIAGSTNVGPNEEAILNLSLGENSPLAFIRKNAVPESNTRCLDIEFAKKLKVFMEATKEATGHMPQISAGGGWRSNAAQNAAAARGNSGARAGGSPHNYGLAADFNDAPKNVIQWMRDNVGSARDPARSGFGLETIGWPKDGCGLPFGCDPAHFQLVNWQSAARSTTGCIDPNNDGLGPPGPPSQPTSPLQSLANLFRPQQQPPLPPPMPPQQLPPASTQPITTAFNQPPPSQNPPASIPPTDGGTVTKSPTPKTATEILNSIINATTSTTTVGNKTRPLSEEELRRLREGKTSISYADQPHTQAPTSGSAPNAPTTGTTFMSPEGIAIAVVDRGQNVTPEQRLRAIYAQIIRRVSLAIDEITRILRGEPKPTPQQQRQWSIEESWASEENR